VTHTFSNSRVWSKRTISRAAFVAAFAASSALAQPGSQSPTTLAETGAFFHTAEADIGPIVPSSALQKAWMNVSLAPKAVADSRFTGNRNRDKDKNPADDADESAENEAQRETELVLAEAKTIQETIAALNQRHDAIEAEVGKQRSALVALEERAQSASVEMIAQSSLMHAYGGALPEPERAAMGAEIRARRKELADLRPKIVAARAEVETLQAQAIAEIDQINSLRETLQKRYHEVALRPLNGQTADALYSLDVLIQRSMDRLDLAWDRGLRAVDKGPEALLAANAEIASLAQDLEDLRALRNSLPGSGNLSPQQIVSDLFPELGDEDSPFNLGEMKTKEELAAAAEQFGIVAGRVDAVNASLQDLARMLNAQKRAAEADAADTRDLARFETGAERDRLTEDAKRLDDLAAASGARADVISLEANTLRSRVVNAGVRFAEAVAALDAAQEVRLPPTEQDLEARNRDLLAGAEPPPQRQAVSVVEFGFAGVEAEAVVWGDAAGDPAFQDAEDPDPADDPAFEDAQDPDPADDPAFEDAEDLPGLDVEAEFMIIRTTRQEEIILRTVPRTVEIVEVDNRQPVVEVVDTPEPEPVIEWVVVGEEGQDGARRAERRAYPQQVEIVNVDEEVPLPFEVVGEIDASELPAVNFDQGAAMHRAFLFAEASDLGMTVDPAADARTLATAIEIGIRRRLLDLVRDRYYVRVGLESAIEGNLEERAIAPFRSALARIQADYRQNRARLSEVRRFLGIVEKRPFPRTGAR
jgi:hypothetical protein